MCTCSGMVSCPVELAGGDDGRVGATGPETETAEPSPEAPLSLPGLLRSLAPWLPAAKCILRESPAGGTGVAWTCSGTAVIMATGLLEPAGCIGATPVCSGECCPADTGSNPAG